MSRLLSGTLSDPDGGGMLSVPTRHIAIADDLAGQEAALLAQAGLGKSALLLADANTFAVLGQRVATAVAGVLTVRTLVLEGMPKPDMETVGKVAAAIGDADFLIAVGSGTINDLAKYAAHRANKPYVVFATAPSMNGYTSVNAAITEHGHKKSLPARAPVAAYFDLTVLSEAPARLIRSGFGDSLCRSTAQADWQLSHLLLGTPYRSAPFMLLAVDEPQLLRSGKALLEGDRLAMASLVRTLVMSGFGMTICGGSYPASQAEHLVSHYIDMFGSADWPMSYHGEHIAVTTLSIARLQARLLSAPWLDWRPQILDNVDFMHRYGAAAGNEIWAEMSAKRAAVMARGDIARRLAEDWGEISAEIRKDFVAPDLLAAACASIGAPTRPADIGVPDAFYGDALRHAREIRNRFTCLDLDCDTKPVPALAEVS
jgi:glycerol-1-phosphate dehydrogenase [NAD(P)+]